MSRQPLFIIGNTWSVWEVARHLLSVFKMKCSKMLFNIFSNIYPQIYYFQRVFTNPTWLFLLLEFRWIDLLYILRQELDLDTSGQQLFSHHHWFCSHGCCCMVGQFHTGTLQWLTFKDLSRRTHLTRLWWWRCQDTESQHQFSRQWCRRRWWFLLSFFAFPWQ